MIKHLRRRRLARAKAHLGLAKHGHKAYVVQSDDLDACSGGPYLRESPWMMVSRMEEGEFNKHISPHGLVKVSRSK